jgi:hypothetical protein
MLRVVDRVPLWGKRSVQCGKRRKSASRLGQDQVMTGLPRIALGTAVLTAERLAGRTSASSPVAIAVGLADQGRKSARNAAKRLTSVRLKAPTLNLKQVLHDAGVRGAIAMSRSRREAEAALRSATDNSFGWAEQKVVPKVVEDLMPQGASGDRR